MTTRRTLRPIVFFVTLALTASLAMAQGGLRPVAKSPMVRLSDGGAGDQPSPSHGPDAELLVGELSCRADPFGSDIRVTFVAHGTIEVATGGMGEVIGRLIVATENPCPGMNQAATEAVQEAGCTAGPVGNDTITFVCHDKREKVLEVMATVSRGVLTGAF